MFGVVNLHTTGMNLSLKFKSGTVPSLLCIPASILQIFPLRVDDLCVLQGVVSQQFPIQRVWKELRLLIELVDVLMKGLRCRTVFLDSTFFCVRILRQGNLHCLGSEMNVTLSFLFRSDELVVGPHLLFSLL